MAQPLGAGGVGGGEGGLAIALQARQPLFEPAQVLAGHVGVEVRGGAGLVQRVDGLVRQEPIRHIAARERHGGFQGGRLDADHVVLFVGALQSAQDLDGLLAARLLHPDGLEAALEGRVGLDVLAVLVGRRRADAAQLAAGQHRLHERGRVHRALGRPGADHGMKLVDEQNHPTGQTLDLAQKALEALLELAAVLRARHQPGQIQGQHRLVPKPRRHAALDDALGQALDDGGLADTGLADKHRVVLGAAREHLDQAVELGVAADHRVELAGGGDRREVPRVTGELVRQPAGAGVARPGLGASGRRLGPGADRGGVEAVACEQGRAGALGLGGDAREQLLGADVAVARLEGQLVGELEGQLEPGAHLDASRLERRLGRVGRVEGAQGLWGIEAGLAQPVARAGGALGDGRHQHGRLDVRRAAIEREAGGVLHDGVGVGRHAREHVLAGARVRREERLQKALQALERGGPVVGQVLGHVARAVVAHVAHDGAIGFDAPHLDGGRPALAVFAQHRLVPPPARCRTGLPRGFSSPA
ncbi:hypothetical protein D3C72_938320 [compost metagenome]